MIEEVMRTLLALRWPGVLPAGRAVDTPVSHVDLAPTVLQAAGTGFAAPVDGASLLPLATGQTRSRQGVLASETFGHGYGDIVDARMTTDGHYKLVVVRGQLNELYDLHSDPYELENLINQPAFQPVRQRLEKDLHRWQQETGDPVEIWD
jgi:arylsulfatase A-like enzyme